MKAICASRQDTNNMTCIWFTGLSGAGKTTILNILARMLPAYAVLDGIASVWMKDYSPSHPLSMGYSAADLVRSGQGVICAAVSTLEDRDKIRAMFLDDFIEVLVDTPLIICKDRDPRMSYAKGLVPLVEYERGNPEITLCTVCKTPEENAEIVLERIQIT